MTLAPLGSIARREPDQPGLLPCRVHSFHRGLPGLWVCLDPQCGSLLEGEKGGVAGRLYAQPREFCDCGARVFELFTCRNCGTAYARAYTDSVEEPSFLWAEPGSELLTAAGRTVPLEPLDMLLEEPTTSSVEPADLDLLTGRLNPPELGVRSRTVYLRMDRHPTSGDPAPGEFKPCGVCGRTERFGRTYVQDHQTKGDQPFQALVARQVQVQPPTSRESTPFAPLRGRKVLVFSDSRQTAARLAPNLQKYSMQDVLRPLLLFGYRELQELECLRPILSLEDVYLATLVAGHLLGVRLRPKLKTGETFHQEVVVERAVRSALLQSGDDDEIRNLLITARGERPPDALLSGIFECLTHQHYGLESLALAFLLADQRFLAQHNAKRLGRKRGPVTPERQFRVGAEAACRCSGQEIVPQRVASQAPGVVLRADRRWPVQAEGIRTIASDWRRMGILWNLSFCPEAVLWSQCVPQMREGHRRADRPRRRPRVRGPQGLLPQERCCRAQAPP